MEQRVVVSATSKRISAIGWVLLAFAVLHGLMLVYDYLHPTVFMNADRALARWQAIQGLYQAWSGDRLAEFLASHGIVGDYLFQGLFMAWFGRYGLILLQVGLTLLAGFSVYRIGILLGMATAWSALAGGIYLLLPHTLIFPHQLAAEAIYSPLLTISLWLTIGALVRKDQNALYLGWSGWLGAVLVGIANLIRPVTLLWPLLPVLLLFSMLRRHCALNYAWMAFFPLVVWASFLGLQTGHFGFGASDHDMPHNLYQRTARVVETLPPSEQTEARAQFLPSGAQGTLTLGDYLKFGLRYPAPFLLHSVRDGMVFFAKSGIERIPIDYLMINPAARASLQDADSGWRKHLESKGIGAALGYLWRTQGMVFVLSIGGAVMLLVMMGLALFGARQLLQRQAAPEQRAAIWLLLALPLYLFFTSQVVDAVQSRHRAPAEAALVLLAVAGARALMLRRAARKANDLQWLEVV